MFASGPSLHDVERCERGVKRLCTALNPELVPLTDVNKLDDSLLRMEKLIAGARVRLAARVAESGEWERQGARSAANHAAKKAGTSVAAAQGALDTSKRLADQPDVDAALQNGQLSPAQAGAISDAAKHNPDAEKKLVDGAGDQSLGELQTECGRAKAEGDQNADARRKRIRKARFCRKQNLADGSGQITYRSTKDEVAVIWAVIAAYMDQLFKAQRNTGVRDTFDQRAADALLAMARAAGITIPTKPEPAPQPAPVVQPLFAEPAPTEPPAVTGVVPTEIVCRIDWDAFIRGYPIDGEVCEIAGLGPVPVQLVKDMIASGDPFLSAVVTKGQDVVNVARLGRRPNAWQKTALRWLDPICKAEGCNLAGAEIDHRIDWANLKITALEFLEHLCKHHHRLKTVKGWALVPGKGKRPMVPPDDPRHPMHHTRATG